MSRFNCVNSSGTDSGAILAKGNLQYIFKHLLPANFRTSLETGRYFWIVGVLLELGSRLMRAGFEGAQSLTENDFVGTEYAYVVWSSSIPYGRMCVTASSLYSQSRCARRITLPSSGCGAGLSAILHLSLRPLKHVSDSSLPKEACSRLVGCVSNAANEMHTVLAFDGFSIFRVNWLIAVDAGFF